MANFAMSHHALSRAVDMAVDASEILDAIARPRDDHYNMRTESRWLTRGRITVCMRISPEGMPTVTTVLWAKPSGWVADDQYGAIEGREDPNLSDARLRVKKRRQKY